jgi:hypothetical protein
MQTKQDDEPGAGREKPESVRRDASIGRQVLHALGTPGDLQSVQVRPLWEGHYRVNAYVGADAASARVAHSYFLRCDGDGNISTCSPAIARRY